MNEIKGETSLSDERDLEVIRQVNNDKWMCSEYIYALLFVVIYCRRMCAK